jgi:hypothetical protein
MEKENLPVEQPGIRSVFQEEIPEKRSLREKWNAMPEKAAQDHSPDYCACGIGGNCHWAVQSVWRKGKADIHCGDGYRPVRVHYLHLGRQRFDKGEKE